MHIHAPCPPSVVLTDATGRTFAYPDMNAAVATLFAVPAGVNRYIHADAVDDAIRHGAIVFYDADGYPVAPGVAADTAWAVRRSQIVRKRRAVRHAIGFRNGPVPHTGHGRGGYCGYRNPTTLGQLRTIAASQTDRTPYRAGRVLPTAWDDVPRFTERSWKRQRKTRWIDRTDTR